jgi:hypothetical protein
MELFIKSQSRFPFVSGCHILRDNGVVADIRFHWLRSYTTVTHQSVVYRFSRRWSVYAFTMSDGPALFTLEKEGYFSGSYKFKHKDTDYTLTPAPTSFRSHYHIMRSGVKIGFINKVEGFWRPVQRCELPDELPELASVFLICAVIHEESRTAG